MNEEDFKQYIQDNNLLALNRVESFLESKDVASEETIKELSKCIVNNPNIIKVNLQGCHINSNDLSLLSELIKDSNVIALNLSYNMIDSRGIEELAKMYKLAYLDISCSNQNLNQPVSGTEWENLRLHKKLSKLKIDREEGAALAKLKKLEYLDISGNFVRENGISEIVDMELSTLKMSNTLLHYPASSKPPPQNVYKLFLMPNLKFLDLSYNNLPMQAIKTLCKKMDLWGLNISGNNITSPKIVEGLGNMKNLSWLDISCNLISPEVKNKVLNTIALHAAEHGNISKKIMEHNDIASWQPQEQVIAGDVSSYHILGGISDNSGVSE